MLNDYNDILNESIESTYKSEELLGKAPGDLQPSIIRTFSVEESGTS